MNSFNPLSDNPDTDRKLVIGAKPLPVEFVDRVKEIASAGGMDEVYAAKCETWFYRYLETRRATEAARFAGFENAQLSWKGNQLVKKFKSLITEALVLGLAGAEPLAMKRLEDIAAEDYVVPLIGKDPDTGNPYVVRDSSGQDVMVKDAKIMANIVKASEIILRKGHLPDRKSMELNVRDETESESRWDWRSALDDMVLRFGVGAVRESDMARNRADFRAYLAEKYPIKVVNEGASGAAEEIPQDAGSIPAASIERSDR